MKKEKEIIRKIVWERLAKEGISKLVYGKIPPFKGQDKASQLLRKLEIYQKAKKVFVPPDTAQFEVRLNCLYDRKILIMATPGLKDGFYQLDQSIPKALWEKAVRASLVTKYGKKLKTSLEEIGKIDLMITGACAVSIKGERIGKGSGFFDWEFKILSEIGAVDDKTPIIAIVHDLQIFENLPFEEKDVSINYIVTPTQIIKIDSPPPRKIGIDWHFVSKKLINKMRPLKELKKTVYNK